MHDILCCYFIDKNSVVLLTGVIGKSTGYFIETAYVYGPYGSPAMKVNRLYLKSYLYSSARLA